MSRLLHEARAALNAGNIPQAENFAKAAARLQIPEAMFAPGEDRPGLVLLDIQRARKAAASGVVQASANVAVPATGVSPASHQAAQALYNPASDNTRNVPAAYQPLMAQNTQVPAPPKPIPTANPGSSNAAAVTPQAAVPSLGMKLYQQGEAALRAGDGKKAMDFFRKASVYQNQLDPLTAQRLQDHLQLLSQPNATTPAAPTQTMAQDAAAKQQILARQVLNDIMRQENRAAKVRESDPVAGLKILEESRAAVEKAGLEPTARTALLTRADRGINEMKQFIEDNRARIELTDRNREVLAAIERDKKHQMDVQQKLGELVEQFNQKMEEQSYAEAEIIAKRAVELAPDNITASQLLLNAKFIRRIQNNRALADAKESGFLDQLASVDESSTPFDDRIPYRMPKDWNELSSRRAKLLEKYRPARSERELEIEQKLKTPVSASFDGAPLSVVLDQLSQLAQVNLFLDPQGLQEQGVSTDTPITINLKRDISLRSALHLILQPLHLDYVIKDEVLKVTSEDYRAGNLIIESYNVADLVVPIPNFVPNSRMGMSGAYNDGVSRVGFGGSGTFGGSTPPLGVFSANNPQGANVPSGVLAQAGMSPLGGPGAGPLGVSGGTMPMGFGPGGMGGGTQADFASLIDLITTTIAPESWTDVGGEGSISQYENNLTLVVSQTQEVHEDIVDLLEQLRRLQDLQVTIEVRFITLNDNFFERIGVDFDFDIDDDIDRAYQVFGRVIGDTTTDGDTGDTGGDTGTTTDGETTSLEPARNTADVDHDRSVVVGMSAPGIFSADLDIPFTQNSYGLAIPQFGGFDASAGASLGFAILSDIEAYFFINAAQGDKRTNVLQAPKVTLFNGQQATVSDSSQKPFVMGLVPVVGDFAVAQQPVIVILSEGTSLTVQAVVSADRRFVRLTVVPFFSSIGDVDTFSFTGETSSTSDTSTEGPQVAPDDSTKVNDVQTRRTVASTVQLPTYSFVTVTTTVSVPDGGTVLLGGIKRLSEGRNEFGTPMLNKIPYISRLFRNVAIGRETQSLMMMVTPRIIIQEEEEERIGVVPPSGP
ncbi:MAG: general secretion pathway protein GspD [Pirellulales bacterium]|nr:general secretion pathway protein GspD [Pirellulales bacterium]